MTHGQQGFSLILSTIMLGLVMAYGFLVFSSTLSIQNVNKTFERSLVASQLAEAGAHKAIYCLRATSGTDCGGTYGDAYVGENDVPLGDGTYSVTVSGTGNTRSIVAVGTAAGGRTQTLKLEMTSGFQSVPVDGFDFAVLLDQGGTFTMENNSDVNHGTAYIGTNLTCGNGASFNGYDLFNYKVGGTVTGCRDGIRDLHADVIANDRTTRDAYYKVRSSTTVGRFSYPGAVTPIAPALPTLDVDFWRTKAEAGGTHDGDYWIPNGTSVGPLRIDGDLHTSNNAVITLTGPIWVNGDVYLDNNSVVKLDPALSQTSSIILADSLVDPVNHGRIFLANNVSMNSASDGSYVILASTNTSTSAVTPSISIANNATSVVTWAPYGSVNLSNNAVTNAVVAKTLYLNNGCAVNYDNAGVTPSNMNIVTTSSTDDRWMIKPATWREYW
jgi:hypothetical protein